MKEINNEILAKSEPKISLEVHVKDALEISEKLQKAFPQASKIFGEKFWEILKFTIIFHDLGKSHSEFQKLLKGEKNNWKHHRHELFSFPFIQSLNFENEIKDLIKLVVLGHHKDFESLDKFLDEFYLQEDDEDLLEILGTDSNSFEKDFDNFVNKKSVLEFLNLFQIQLKNIENKNPHRFIIKYLQNPKSISNYEGLKLALLLGAFNHCDHLSSAFIKDIRLIEEKVFQFLDEIRENLIHQNKDFYNHQIETSKVIGNLILTAPTGSGKTEAAMLWLKNQIEKTGQGRCFYVLPFTASINAMFERLSKNSGDEFVGMLHGKLAEYLNNYFQELQYSTIKKNESIKNLKELYKTIVPPIKIITPFQLLRNLFGLKFFEKGIFTQDSINGVVAGSEFVKDSFGIKFTYFKQDANSVKQNFQTKLLDGAFENGAVKKINFEEINYDLVYYNSKDYFMGSGGGEIYAYVIDFGKQQVYSAHFFIVPERPISLYLSPNIESKAIKDFLISQFRKDYPELKIVKKDQKLEEVF